MGSLAHLLCNIIANSYSSSPHNFKHRELIQNRNSYVSIPQSIDSTQYVCQLLPGRYLHTQHTEASPKLSQDPRTSQASLKVSPRHPYTRPNLRPNCLAMMYGISLSGCGSWNDIARSTSMSPLGVNCQALP